MNRRELEAAIRDEAAEWPGVSVEFEQGGKHPIAKLMFGELMLRRAYGGNQESVAFPHKMIADMRRIMIQLGAQRDQPEPSKEETERRYSKPNDGAAKRPDVRQSEPAPVESAISEKLANAGIPIPPTAGNGSDEDDAEAEDRRNRLIDVRAAAAAIQDGIHFDLDEAVYHAIQALGGGSICDLNVSPGQFWKNSWLDPDADEMDEDATAAQIIGRAYHVARLEPHRFETAYVRKIDKKDFPDCRIWNGTQIGEALAERGEPKKKGGENVGEQAARLQACGYDRPIWPLELARWEAGLDAMEPRPIAVPGAAKRSAAQTYDDIVRDSERLRAIPEIADMLATGESEVSVVWTDENGVRCKARFDKLASDRFVELKTYANSQGKHVLQAINDSVRYNRYYVAACHYRDASEMIRVGGLQVIGDATDAQRAMIAAIQTRPMQLALWYVFQEKAGIPNIYAREFKFTQGSNTEDAIRELEESGASDDHLARARHFQEIAGSKPTPTMIARRGAYEVERAKALFMLYSEVYQAGEPWAPIDPIGVIDDLDFNERWLEERI